MYSISLVCLNNFVGRIFGPVLLSVFKFCMISDSSLGEVDVIKKVLGLDCWR